MDDILELLGTKQKHPEITDYDDLTPDEQETYRKMLDQVSSSQISLEDVKKHIHTMRQAVELEVSKMPVTDARFEMYRARQYCYILLEAVFEKPERAREMLKQVGRGNTKL